MSEQIVTPDTAALTVPNKDAKINLLDLNLNILDIKYVYKTNQEVNYGCT